MKNQNNLYVEFQEIGTNIRARLIREINPELYDAFVEHLPFTGLATHSVVSGMNITCWTPVYAVVPIRTWESIDEMPVGRIFLSGSGNKLLFKYGPQTEWVSCPPIGLVEGEDLDKLKDLGPVIWESVFITKRLIHISFSLETQK